MENAMMVRQKDEIVADLYALRAALSVISQKNDEIIVLENGVKEVEEELGE